MAAGYKGKFAMARNKLEPPPKASWRDHLLTWEDMAVKRYLIKGSSSNANQDVISDCMDQMQVLFPGNYTLMWYNSAPNEYHLTVHFEDPKHETMWRLKYGWG